jgi:mRNA-degrading endonuclease RelE of RelBE toxin-antitoxin system
MNVELLEAAQAELDHAYQSLGKSARRCLIKRFPYGVIYGVDKDKIVIIAVAHLHRKPDYWENRTD